MQQIYAKASVDDQRRLAGLLPAGDEALRKQILWRLGVWSGDANLELKYEKDARGFEHWTNEAELLDHWYHAFGIKP